MLGTLRELGYGPDRVVPLAFHVDYFNTPWKDRFSDPAYSRREMAYNAALKRDDLYFTPMLMVDGRYPMLGSDRPRAAEALRRAAADRPGAALRARLAPGSDPDRAAGSKRVLTVRVSAARGDAAAGRDVMVGAAVYEDPVTTDVRAGENAGKTLAERYAVRRFVWERFRLDPARPKDLTFTLAAAPDWDAARLGVAVWVQDWSGGRVYQADALPWRPAAAAPAPAGPVHEKTGAH